MNDYIEQASRTKSDQFYAKNVPLVDWKLSLKEATQALQQLDLIKKALFYGRDYVAKTKFSPHLDNVALAIAYSFPDYQDLTDDLRAQRGRDVIHAIIGKATEAGELLEHLLAVTNGEDFDAVNVIEEIGDGFWYDAIGLAALNSTFEEAQHRNIAKLRKRFPEKFTEQNANQRDLEAEREVLEVTRRDDSAEWKCGDVLVHKYGQRVTLIDNTHGVHTVKWFDVYGDLHQAEMLKGELSSCNTL